MLKLQKIGCRVCPPDPLKNAKGFQTAIVEQLSCGCNPGKVYVSRSTYNAHKKTQRHLAWENVSSKKHAASSVIELELEIARLCKRIHELEQYIASSPHIRKVSESTKKKIAANQGWKCDCCDMLLSHVFEIDHIQPLFLGGSNEQDNLSALCRECHGKKTAEDRDKWNSIQRHMK
jgi:hypothetical protein